MKLKVKLTGEMEWSRLGDHVMQRCRGTLTQQCLTARQVPPAGRQV